MSGSMITRATWWREPMVWLLIALPLSAVVGGAITIWYATRYADAMVTDDFHKEGVAIQQDTERDALARRLGLSAQIDQRGGSLHLTLRGTLASPPGQLLLRLVHPTEATQDIQLVLSRNPDGTYSSPLPEAIQGSRQWLLEPLEHDWRLTAARHDLPLAGPLTLDVKPD